MLQNKRNVGNVNTSGKKSAGRKNTGSRISCAGAAEDSLPLRLLLVCYNLSMCSELGNFTASIATPAQTGQFSALA